MTFSDPITNARPCAGSRPQSANDSCLDSLIHAVAEAVRKVDDRMLRPVAGGNGSLAFEARALLAILTFCYARQIYGSTEVATRLRGDAHLRRACNDEIPDADTLRRFRT